MDIAEDYASILSALEAHSWAIRLLAAVEGARQRDEVTTNPMQAEQVAQTRAAAGVAMTPEDLDHEYDQGRALSVEEAMTQAHAATAQLVP